MVDLKLDFDEEIVLQGSGCEKCGTEELVLDEIYLTNKNIICVYEKSNGLFTKSETISENIPLDSIKIVNGNVQIMEVDNDEYGLGLQIIYKNGKRELFLFDNPKKEHPKWRNAIIATINGDPIPTDSISTDSKITEKEKVVTAAVATAFASKIKSAVDSTKHTLSDISQQIKETNIFEFDTKKEEIKEPKVESIVNEVKYKFCSICGEKLIYDAKFCQGCGAKVGVSISKQEALKKEVQEDVSITRPNDTTESKERDEPVVLPIQEEYTERKSVYEGKIHKCPNCGNVVKQTDVICNCCGFHLSGKQAISSAMDFQQQILKIEMTRQKKKGFWELTEPLNVTDKQIIALIKSYPIPNSIEDIVEFFHLAIGNIDFNKSKKTFSNSEFWAGCSPEREISNAWIGKMQQIYKKAELFFPNEPEFAHIKETYLSVMKKLKW